MLLDADFSMYFYVMTWGIMSLAGISTNNKEEKFNMQESLKDLERQLACIKSQIDKTNREYQEQLQDHHKVNHSTLISIKITEKQIIFL